jgi:serine protease
MRNILRRSGPGSPAQVLGVAVAAFLMVLTGGANAQGPDPDRYIVRFAERGDTNAARQAISQAGGSVLLEVPGANAVAARLPARALHGLRKNPHIELIEQDGPRFPMAQSVPYGIPMVQANQFSDYPGAIKVCVIDSGIDLGHEDFLDSLDGSINGTPVSGSGDWFEDTCGHGTHVAGTIKAQDNNIGVVGVTPGVSLHIIKVFDGSDCGWAYSSTLVNAAYACRDAGANIISMSLGCVDSGRGGPFACANSTENNAFQSLYDAGILSVAAAGNAGTTQKSYPASYASVVSVAAVDANEQVADFSQQNDAVELAAPGVSVLSTVPWLDENTLSSDGSTWSGHYMDGAARTAGVSGTIADGSKCTATDTAWNGRVVLCQRGDISFADKVNNVRLSGGVAAVVYNNIASDSSCGPFLGTLDGSSTIPAISLSCQQGSEALAKAGKGGTVISQIDPDGSGYEPWSGTSMATPHVSGVAALVWSHNPPSAANGWSNVDIREALQATAKDLGAPGRDNAYGYGLVQAYAAFQHLGGNGGGGGDPENTPPTASFTYLCTDLSCSFDGSASEDPDGSIASYAWTFGDGGVGSGETANHTYAAGGTYSVELTVTDNAGATGKQTQSVTVSAPPTGGITLSAVGYKVRGFQTVDLSWSGASPVHIYRNGPVIAPSVGGGTYTDNIGQRGSGSYSYKVCESEVLSNCSNEVTVTF